MKAIRGRWWLCVVYVTVDKLKSIPTYIYIYSFLTQTQQRQAQCPTSDIWRWYYFVHMTLSLLYMFNGLWCDIVSVNFDNTQASRFVVIEPILSLSHTISGLQPCSSIPSEFGLTVRSRVFSGLLVFIFHILFFFLLILLSFPL